MILDGTRIAFRQTRRRLVGLCLLCAFLSAWAAWTCVELSRPGLMLQPLDWRQGRACIQGPPPPRRLLACRILRWVDEHRPELDIRTQLELATHELQAYQNRIRARALVWSRRLAASTAFLAGLAVLAYRHPRRRELFITSGGIRLDGRWLPEVHPHRSAERVTLRGGRRWWVLRPESPELLATMADLLENLP